MVAFPRKQQSDTHCAQLGPSVSVYRYIYCACVRASVGVGGCMEAVFLHHKSVNPINSVYIICLTHILALSAVQTENDIIVRMSAY